MVHELHLEKQGQWLACRAHSSQASILSRKSLIPAMSASSARSGLVEDPINDLDSQSTMELDNPDPQVTLTQEWSIRCNFQKKLWSVQDKDLQEVQGMRFVRISKWDRQFVFFATGKGLSMKNVQLASANVKPFDHLVALRKMTSLQVAKEMLEKEGQKRKVREEDKDLLEHRFVSVTCPAFDFEGQVEGPLQANMLWSIKSSDLWVEFSSQNFLYLRKMVQKGLADRDHGRTRAKKQVFHAKSPKKASPTKAAKSKSSPTKSPKKKIVRKPTRFSKFIVDELERTGAAHSQPQTARDWNNYLHIPQPDTPDDCEDSD